MFRRILTTVVTAATLLSAAPALAEQSDKDVEQQKLSPCCERMAMQLRELSARIESAEKRERNVRVEAAENEGTERAEQKVAPRFIRGPG